MKIIQLRKTPSDAELEAERDRQHHAEVQAWLAADQSDLCAACEHPNTMHNGPKNRCTDQVVDFYGHWSCLCLRYRRTK